MRLTPRFLVELILPIAALAFPGCGASQVHEIAPEAYLQDVHFEPARADLAQITPVGLRRTGANKLELDVLVQGARGRAKELALAASGHLNHHPSSAVEIADSSGDRVRLKPIRPGAHYYNLIGPLASRTSAERQLWIVAWPVRAGSFTFLHRKSYMVRLLPDMLEAQRDDVELDASWHEFKVQNLQFSRR